MVLAEKVFALGLISLMIAVCVVQILYCEQLLRAESRMTDWAPRAVRKLHAVLNFAPTNSPRQVRISRMTAIVGACFFSVAFIAVAFLF